MLALLPLSPPPSPCEDPCNTVISRGLQTTLDRLIDNRSVGVAFLCFQLSVKFHAELVKLESGLQPLGGLPVTGRQLNIVNCC